MQVLGLFWLEERFGSVGGEGENSVDREREWTWKKTGFDEGMGFIT